MFKAMVTELSQGLWINSVTQVNSETPATIYFGWKALRIFGNQFQLDHHQPKGIGIHRCSQGGGDGERDYVCKNVT